MTAIKLHQPHDQTPSIKYRVMWVDEDGDHVEAYDDLTSDEADAKVISCKEHGFHTYKAEMKPVSSVPS